MAGKIKQSVIDEVRERARIDEIIGEYVALKPAGTGALKGLCPIHGEKTPSFSVSVHSGLWYCFGCGAGGDVFKFIEELETIGFGEAVEFLARKTGVQIEYEEGTGRSENKSEVTRGRLIDAHRIAVDFFQAQLAADDGTAARDFLNHRGFHPDAITYFQIGYSPNSWDALLKELRRKGFTEKEILASGLVSSGSRGVYDRFRGRVMWPIFSITGEPIGFGARKLDEDEDGPKYLNTPETLIYKKSQVLYGLNLAKKTISAERKIVIVEGYTDVMAAHLSGITNAVATCGTAFGDEHAKIARRLIGDSNAPASGVILQNGHGFGGEVIFTFDGDSAGKKAAMRAFKQDSSFGAQTFVAVAPNNLDPADIWHTLGAQALREMIAKRRPLFEFVLRNLVGQYALNSAEGRVAAMRACIPVIINIKDNVLREEYAVRLAGWLGLAVETVQAEVQTLLQTGGRGVPEITANGEDGADIVPVETVLRLLGEITDPVERIEHSVLQIMLQLPRLASLANAGELSGQVFTTPIYRSVHDAIMLVGGIPAFTAYYESLIAQGYSEEQGELRAARWFVGQITAQAFEPVRSAVTQLSVEPIRENRSDHLWAYVRGVMMALIRQGLVRQIVEVRADLNRLPEDDPRREELLRF
ncbi:DNA primase [Arcanobacterium hippocoleae]